MSNFKWPISTVPLLLYDRFYMAVFFWGRGMSKSNHIRSVTNFCSNMLDAKVDCCSYVLGAKQDFCSSILDVKQDIKFAIVWTFWVWSKTVVQTCWGAKQEFCLKILDVKEEFCSNILGAKVCFNHVGWDCLFKQFGCKARLLLNHVGRKARLLLKIFGCEGRLMFKHFCWQSLVE